MHSPLILCLDGSTGTCSVALLSPECSGSFGDILSGWGVRARRQGGDGRSQAKVLLRLVDETLHEVSAEPESLSAVVVGAGPGTFTGVRITVATARALALALSIPVVGVSTLAALAAATAAVEPRAGFIVPVVDARRGQVFYGVYRRDTATGDKEARWVRGKAFDVCDRGELSARALAEAAAAGNQESGCGVSVMVVGESVTLVPELAAGLRFEPREVMAEYLVSGQGRLVEPGSRPEGDRLGEWLLDEASTTSAPGVRPVSGRPIGEPGTPESVRPIYVRSPDADIHITKMRDPWATKATES